MPFSTFNGLDVGAADATPRRSIKRTGRRGRSFRGQLRDAHRSRRRTWEAQTCYLEFAEADALERWLWGEGHLIGCADGLQASTGLVPEPSYGGAVTILPGGTTKFGTTGFARFTGDDVSVLEYDAQLPAAWSVAWYEEDDSQVGWHSAVKLSSGVGYWDGVQDNTVGTSSGPGAVLVQVANGKVFFSRQQLGAPAQSTSVDDIILYPYEVTESAAVGLNALIVPPGPLPVLIMDGDIVGGSPTFVVCEARTSDYNQGVINSSLQNNIKRLNFNIIEVEDSFVVR